jgi:hypothetical protein
MPRNLNYEFHPSPKSTKRHFFEWRFVSLRWSLASQQLWPVVISTELVQATSAGLPLLWRLLLPCACCFAVWPDILQQPVHHWHPTRLQSTCRSSLPLISTTYTTRSRSSVLILVNIVLLTSKNNRFCLMLTLRAVVGAPSRNHNPLDLTSAVPACLPGALIHVMLELKESLRALRVHIVRYR